MNKRGLSDVVTTVLIILLVLAAVAIIWAFLRPAIRRSVGQLEPGLLTSTFEIPAESVSIDNNAKSAEFKIKRYAGEGRVVGFYAVLTDASGNSKRYRENVSINELETRTLTVDYSDSGLDDITKISIAPIVLNIENAELIGQEVASLDVTNNARENAGGGGVTCTPDCAGKICGASNGCGGICATGSCGSGQSCSAGVCRAINGDGICTTGENYPADSSGCSSQSCKAVSCTNGCVYANSPDGQSCNPSGICTTGLCLFDDEFSVDHSLGLGSWWATTSSSEGFPYASGGYAIFDRSNYDATAYVTWQPITTSNYTIEAKVVLIQQNGNFQRIRLSPAINGTYIRPAGVADYGLFDLQIYWANGFTGIGFGVNRPYTLKWILNPVDNSFTWQVFDGSAKIFERVGAYTSVSNINGFYMGGTESSTSDFEVDYVKVTMP